MNTRAAPATQVRSTLAFVTLILAITAGACSRSVAVQTQPTAVYAILVQNSTGGEIVVSYDDGTGPRALGTVLDGRTERFIIAAPATTDVEVSATSREGARRYGPYTVTLEAGTNVPVTIR